MVTKNKAGIVIICLGIYVEGPFKVNSVKCRVPYGEEMQLEKATLTAGRILHTHSQRPRTYQLLGQGHCSWSAQSPYPVERGERVQDLKGMRECGAAQNLRHGGDCVQFSTEQALFCLIWT